MTRKLDRTQIAQVARIVAPMPTPVIVAHPPRHFDLPFGLFAATAGAYLAFVAVMATAFATEGLIVPIGIIVAFLAAFFGIPALFARMNPQAAERALTWAEFRRKGIQTHTGRMAAKDATIQVLVLPTLIVCWGLAVAAIVALT